MTQENPQDFGAYRVDMKKLEEVTKELSNVLQERYGTNIIDGIVACFVMAVYGGKILNNDSTMKRDLVKLLAELWEGVTPRDGGLAMPPEIVLREPAKN